MNCFITCYPSGIQMWNYAVQKKVQNIVSPVSAIETDEKVPTLSNLATYLSILDTHPISVYILPLVPLEYLSGTYLYIVEH